MLLKNAALHFGFATLLFLLWSALDTWYVGSGLALANALSMTVAALVGITWATVVHEWLHLAGATLAGAQVTPAQRYTLLVYDYDYAGNSMSQFNVMSVAGQMGSWIAVFALAWLVPPDNAGRAMLVAGAVGSAIFAAGVELPPLFRAQRSGDPFAELSKITPAVLGISGLLAITVAGFTWGLRTA
ncbi:MAG: hypothetical protein V2I66_11105 [Halieaceae bacterium]|jgi:hypothetical protein|nr:hypothetical protein [Halieaceae bacterium]